MASAGRRSSGIAIAAIGYAGHATATEGWVMFALLATWAFGALVSPVTNAYMSQRIAADGQGDLPGAAFLAAALCALVCLAIYLRATGRAPSESGTTH